MLRDCYQLLLQPAQQLPASNCCANAHLHHYLLLLQVAAGTLRLAACVSRSPWS
jgi:hypothetical protein